MMVKSPRMPFPSFTLALSSIQERNASNVEPPVDLMKTFDPRLPRYDRKTRDTTDEDRSDTETVFEERIDSVGAGSKGSISGSRKRNRGLRNFSVIYRVLKNALLENK